MSDDRRTILVVDDDAAIRDSVRAVLRDEGYRVETAESGAAALEVVGSADLVVLDVWMPDMDGIEVLGRVRASHPALPVVVVSGHGNIETAVRATKLGAATFLEKPFSVDTLLAVIDENLGAGAAAGEAAIEAARPAGGAAAKAGPQRVQRTLGRSVVGGGLGLHSGVRTGLILQPAPPGSGVRFASVSGAHTVEAVVANVDSTGYATTLFNEGVVVRTVEHLMATLNAYGVTNVLVKIQSEVPILDGSAAELCELVESAGIVDQDATVSVATLDREVRVDRGDDEWIVARPYDGLRVTYELCYPPPVGEQTYTFEWTGGASFRDEIAPARTFGFVEEIRALERAGLGQGGQLSNFILIGEQRQL